MRRGMVLELLSRTGANGLTQPELENFFRSENLDARQALRRLVVRHAHEWGDLQSFASFAKSPELQNLSAEAKRRMFDEALRPYVFWNHTLSMHAGLPADQVVYSYNPITFLAALAMQQAGGRLRWPAADVADQDTRGEPKSPEALSVWTTPPALIPSEMPVFGPLAPLDIVPRRREEIPLIVLPDLNVP